MIQVIRSPIKRTELHNVAEQMFSDMVKAVVDIQKGIMAIGGELHADEEKVLLGEGGAQGDLWGINLYPQIEGEAMIEFDSMINVRPSQGNRSRSVEDAKIRDKIIHIVKTLII